MAGDLDADLAPGTALAKVSALSRAACALAVSTAFATERRRERHSKPTRNARSRGPAVSWSAPQRAALPTRITSRASLRSDLRKRSFTLQCPTHWPPKPLAQL